MTGRATRFGRPSLVVALIAILVSSWVGGQALGAQPAQTGSPDLSGTWKLDRKASEIDPEVGFAGLGGSDGVPSMLYVTQAENGTIIVGSNANTSQARTYRSGDVSTAPLGDGEVDLRSRWWDASLVAEEVVAENGQPSFSEILALAEGGESLRVAITLKGRASMLVYRKATEEPPCSEWSTPCRDWSVLALVGARVIDGTGAPPIESATLLVQDGRVLRLGPSDRVEIPSGGTEVDVQGKTITPGLINAHGHVGGTRGLESGPEQYTEENIRAQLALYASYGVTTVASLGGDGEAGVRVRGGRSSRSGPRPPDPSGDPNRGARLLLAGPVVDATTPEAAREQVTAVAALGADLVKIRVDDSLGRTRKMSPEVYAAVIEEAHARKLRVAAHVYYLEDAKGLLRAGADLLAHSVRDREVDDELIALLLERPPENRVCLVPTLTRELSAFVYRSRPDFFDDPYFLRSSDPQAVQRLLGPERQRRIRENPDSAVYEKALETASRNLVRLARAGVPIAFGTDSGPPGRFQGYFEHLELELMAKAGLEPMQILLSATRDAARCLELERVGTLETGYSADFLVLDANPLDDIGNLRQIDSVWIGGRQIFAVDPSHYRADL